MKCVQAKILMNTGASFMTYFKGATAVEFSEMTAYYSEGENSLITVDYVDEKKYELPLREISIMEITDVEVTEDIENFFKFIKTIA